MDAQIDYAVGLPLTILNDTPVADPATPSPGMLMEGGGLNDEVGGMRIAMRERPQVITDTRNFYIKEKSKFST